MKKVAVFLIASLSATPAFADLLNDQQITELFSGNTQKQKNLKTDTESYSYREPTGEVIVETSDGTAKEGQWKVENNQYCSNLSGKWTCLSVRDYGDGTYARVKNVKGKEKVIIKIFSVEKGNTQDL